MFCMLKKKKYDVLMLENITQIVKNKSYLMNSNGEGWHYLEVKKNYQHY